MELSIHHQAQQRQFIATIDDKIAYVKYNISSDGKTFDYYTTFVPIELRRHSIGQKIVKFALDYAKENQHQIIPSCPFIKQYIEQHPEYAMLVLQA